MEYQREGVDLAYVLTAERTGVTHLVHAWHQQGHPVSFASVLLFALLKISQNGPMLHSKDMAGRNTVEGQAAVINYFRLSRPIALYIKEMFKVAYPSYYPKYEKAFEAGVYERQDPGPFLGRAIVWKLQVQVHQDGLDDGPTVIFNCGNYS